MGTGGSRWGAGRPATHVKAESCRRIDARRWQREGILGSGRMGIWAWTDAETGERLASIGYRAEAGAVVLDYTMNGSEVRQRVPILQTDCNYGGSRSWFACPRCFRRVAVLFLRSGAGCICRHCGRIAYGSQCEDDMGRAWRKQRKAEAKLGENWERPKGMHHATREKLLNVIFDCEEQRDRALVMFMATKFPGGFKL